MTCSTVKNVALLLLFSSLLLMSSHSTAKEFDTQEELDAHNAICEPLRLAYRAEFNSMKPTETGMKNARKALRKSTQAYQSAYQQYVGFRNAGDTAGAKAAALEVDKYWAEAGKHQQKVINHLDAGVMGMSEGSNLCKAFYSWRDAQCVKAEFASRSCSAITSLSKWKAVYKKPDIADRKYAESWRQPQDYVFEEPKPEPVATSTPDLSDPNVGGYVMNLHGRAFIERGIRTLPVKVGSILHLDDKVNVEEGSQVEIMIIGAGSIKITELTSFQMPDTTKATAEEKSLFQKALQKFKTVVPDERGDHLHPDSFNKKTDGGTRG